MGDAVSTEQASRREICERDPAAPNSPSSSRPMQHYGLILADDGSDWYFQGSAYAAMADRRSST